MVLEKLLKLQSYTFVQDNSIYHMNDIDLFSSTYIIRKKTL